MMQAEADITTKQGQWYKQKLISQQNMGVLPDTENCRLRMRREYWERFPRTDS